MTSGSDADSIQMTGVVEAFERVPSTCGDRALGQVEDDDYAVSYDVVITDGTKSARVSVRLPFGDSPIVEVGDTVVVDYEAVFPTIGDAHGALTLRDEDGTLIFWIAQTSRSIDELELPEVEVTLGEDVCSRSDACGELTRGDLEVSDGSERAPLTVSDPVQFDELLVFYGANERFELTESCTHAPNYHQVSVAVARIDRIFAD